MNICKPHTLNAKEYIKVLQGIIKLVPVSVISFPTAYKQTVVSLTNYFKFMKVALDFQGLEGYKWMKQRQNLGIENLS